MEANWFELLEVVLRTADLLQSAILRINEIESGKGRIENLT